MESSKVRTGRKVVSGTHKLKNKTYRLGELIEQRREKYDGITVLPIRGVSKEGFIDARQPDADLSLYNVYYKNDFVFNPARMELNSIALNVEFEKAICSSLYEIFYVKRPDLLLPEYLNLFLKRDEFARHCALLGCGSAREYCRIINVSSIDITLPSLIVQQKYVAVYTALQKNLAEYENGLENLKLTCDGFIDKIKNKKSDVKGVKHCRLGELIELFDERNVDGKYTLDDVKGISTDKTFINTKADMNGVSLTSYKIVNHDEFAYVADTSRRGDKIALAYNDSKESLLISSIYTTFCVSHPELLLSGYLSLLFTRSEFDRYARFSSWGSARETFDWNEMCDVKIPLPSIDIQQDIVNIYNVYIERQRIAVELRQKIKTLCPLLIKGSLEE